MFISFPPYFDHMMHLCITQCTYWTPLNERMIAGSATVCYGGTNQSDWKRQAKSLP